MTDKHFSSQYETELHLVSDRLIELGRQVDGQISGAIGALSQLDTSAARQVLAEEADVNALEIEINHEIVSIIAKRQPAARDLRLLMAISKASSNLERIGNAANSMAHKVLTLIGSGARGSVPVQELFVVAKMTTGILDKALDAFAHLDQAAAVIVLKEDRLRSREINSLVHRLADRIIENPSTTSFCVELISLANSLELVVDHARHIAELVIYVVQGVDVRNTADEQVKSLEL
jgi:phosphate transport system protein